MSFGQFFEQDGYIAILKEGRNEETKRMFHYLDIDGFNYPVKLNPYFAGNDKLVQSLKALENGTVIHVQGEIKDSSFYLTSVTTDFEPDQIYLGLPTVMTRLGKLEEICMSPGELKVEDLPEYMQGLVAHMDSEDIAADKVFDMLGVSPDVIAGIANQKGLSFLSYDDPRNEKDFREYLKNKGYKLENGKFVR